MGTSSTVQGLTLVRLRAYTTHLSATLLLRRASRAWTTAPRAGATAAQCSSSATQPEADPFGLDQFLSEVRTGKKKGALDGIGGGGSMAAAGGGGSS